MRTYKLEVTIKVSDNWIEDGFDIREKEEIESLEEKISSAILPYAILESEVITRVKVKKSPKIETVKKLQGY